MNISYRIQSELSEDQIEADVASYLGYITPFWSRRFQLNAVDEQLTGADKLFKNFKPIYLQFKVSEGLKNLPRGFQLLSPNRDLQSIRVFRRREELSRNPTLYFRLRNKAKTANDFQHNILLSLHNPPIQYALYVAPLSLTIEEYNKSLKQSFLERLFIIDPFDYRPIGITSSIRKRYLGLNPFLRGHISIPPHEVITTSNHYYSYSKSGSDLAWHSGESLKGDFRLSSQLEKIFYESYEFGDGFNMEKYSMFIKENFKEFNKDQPYEQTIYDFANFLKTEYDIKLLFLNTNGK
ncbi:hypothetical protein [Fluviicola chungangensis]|uniref:Uncharacterized protein n=1 Tax=Fluviicola chungangensis TaxID=2597671 RepID=A0A556N381_9FLAO|nr:hypothetical protein [Fluviicola chungangensis]TSJ46642.1 hypothetical protein FO442_05645 [Fluviicola chungangensis]